MSAEELFEVIDRALADLPMDLDDERGRRVYAAYLAARVGLGQDGPLLRRLEHLREDLGL